MGEIWPQLLVLVFLIAGFLFLILRLRPGPQTAFPITGSQTSRKIAVRLDRSPLVVILLALIGLLLMVVLVEGAYKLSRRLTTPVVVAPPDTEVKALMAQLASELEEYFRQHQGAYPPRLELLGGAENPHVPALDPYRDPPTPLDYRTDGLSWWLLRSYGPDKQDGINGGSFPLDAYHGERLDSPRLSRFLYDPSNGVHSGGDIILVGGEARTLTGH